MADPGSLMRRIQRIAVAGLVLQGAALSACRAAQDQTSGFAPIYQYMAMSVCVDANDRVVMGLSPVDAACGTKRKIRADEPVPYELHNFRPGAPGCAARYGTLAKVNIPVVANGQTRIVSTTDHGMSGECGQGRDNGWGASVQWFDDSYGFIMGSWSPVALSNFVGERCRVGAPSSARFMRGWTIAPAGLPQARSIYGYRAFPSLLEKGPPQLTGRCPDGRHLGFTTWVRDDFTYTSGKTLGSIISEHYSGSTPAGDAPGPAEQLERTYWTREFGLSRWEKWGRDDWVSPKNGQTSQQLSAALVRSGQCKSPYGVSTRVSPALLYGPAGGQSAFARTIDQAGDQAHVWYMTLCEDYTNVVPRPDGVTPTWKGRLQDAYWVQ